jgi:hypothetical protein
MKLKKRNEALEPQFSNHFIMPSNIDERRAEMQGLTKQFDDRLRLSRASELASWGRLLEAEAMLCPGRHLPMSADELDLLARIHVKQSQYELARKRWQDAIKIGERRVEFEECIRALDLWLEHREQMWIWRIRLCMYLVAILLALWLLIRLGLLSWFSSHEFSSITAF